MSQRIQAVSQIWNTAPHCPSLDIQCITAKDCERLLHRHSTDGIPGPPHELPNHLPSRNLERLEKLLQKTSQKLAQASDERLEAREQLFEREEKRDHLMNTGTELMQRIDALLAKADQETIKPVIQHFEQFKHEHEIYIGLEDDFREVESHLIGTEYALKVRSDKVLKELHRMDPRSEEDSRTVSDDSDNDISTQWPGILAGIERDHPLIARYIFLLGQKGLINDDLYDLHSERHRLLKEKKARGHTESTLDIESENFLAQFEASEKELLDRLATIAEESQQIAQECKELRLTLPFSEEPRQEDELRDGQVQEVGLQGVGLQGVGLQGVGLQGVGLQEQEDELQELEDKLSNASLPESPIKRAQQGLCEKKNPTNTPPDFVNKWLLHQLNLSSFEMPHFINILARITGRNKNEILDIWYNDRTATQAIVQSFSLDNPIFH